MMNDFRFLVFMKSFRLGFAKKGRKYPHDFADGFVPENYFPETLGRRKYYEPSEAGHEKVIADRLKSWWGGRK